MPRSPAVSNSNNLLSPKNAPLVDSTFRSQRKSAALARVDAEQEMNQIEADILNSIQKKAIKKARDVVNTTKKLDPI